METKKLEELYGTATAIYAEAGHSDEFHPELEFVSGKTSWDEACECLGGNSKASAFYTESRHTGTFSYHILINTDAYPTEEKLLRVMLHELAHHYISEDHDDDFYECLRSVGVEIGKTVGTYDGFTIYDETLSEGGD